MLLNIFIFQRCFLSQSSGNQQVNFLFLYFSAKRPRLESSNRKEYDIQSAAMNEWLDKTEINLELLTTDPPNPEEKLTLEEQMVLIKVNKNAFA